MVSEYLIRPHRSEAEVREDRHREAQSFRTAALDFRDSVSALHARAAALEAQATLEQGVNSPITRRLADLVHEAWAVQDDLNTMGGE